MTPTDIGAIGLILAVGVCALLMGLGRRFAKSPCDHKWDVLRTVDVTDGAGITNRDYELQCVHCGDIKRRRV